MATITKTTTTYLNHQKVTVTFLYRKDGSPITSAIFKESENWTMCVYDAASQTCHKFTSAGEGKAFAKMLTRL